MFLRPVPRTDLSVSYNSYTAVTTARILQTISVYGNGALARQYQLNYANSPSSSARSLLQSVTQIGTDGSQLSPIDFTWSTNTPGLGSKWGRSDFDGAPHNYQAADLNGNGMADVIYETNSGGLPSQFRALLSNGSSFPRILLGVRENPLTTILAHNIFRWLTFTGMVFPTSFTLTVTT